MRTRCDHRISIAISRTSARRPDHCGPLQDAIRCSHDQERIDAVRQALKLSTELGFHANHNLAMGIGWENFDDHN